MKRILNNFKLLLVVVTVLVIFNIFVTGSAVSKYLLATKFAIWNVQRNNKFTFGTSFAQLYGDEFNPFKEVTFLDDDGETTEKQAEQQAEQSQRSQTGGSTLAAGWDELEKDVANRIRKSKSSATNRAEDLAALYVTLCQNWNPNFHYKLSTGVICGLLSNSIGEGTAITREDGGPKLNTYADMKDLYINKSGGTGIFGFTDRTLKKNIWSVIEDELLKSGGNLSDSIDLIKATKWQALGFIKYADVLKSKVGDAPYYDRLKFDYPSTYSGDSSNPIISSSTTEAEVMCDWICYHYERNLASYTKSDLIKFFPSYAMYDPIVEETSNGIGIITMPKYRNSRNNLFRRREAKKLYDVLKDAPISISSSLYQSSQSNITPTIGQGNSIWIMGDSRTHQLISYLDGKLKPSKEGATKSLAQWSKTKTSPTYAKYKITENGKTIELNVFGVGSMGFNSSLGGNSSSGETAQYKDYLAQVGYTNNANNVIFLWFGVNGDTPSNYRSMCKDIYGNVPMFQFSVPAGLSQWGTPSVIPFDSKNNILLKEFKDNYIDVCGGDLAFTYNGSDVGTFKTLGKGKYYGGSDFLHFKIPDGYDILWPNIKKGIFDRIK